MEKNKSAWFWIPLLNFASGFPYAIIITVSAIMYKSLGVSNQDIGYYTSWLYLPWVIKPLWSPFIELFATKKKWFFATQLLISILFLGVGLCLPTNHFFVLSLALFWVAAFASASNDVASDGFYLLALSKDKQSFFLGIRSTCYRISMLAANGLLVILAGFLEKKYSNPTKAWSYTILVAALVMIFLTAYNYFSTPEPEKDKQLSNFKSANNFGLVFATFFQKKKIGLILSFILLFRLGESQLLKMLNPFLLDATSKGGLAISTENVGLIYGTVGIISLVIGGILGGIIISKFGLGKMMFPMFLAMHLPIIGFILLALFPPTNLFFVYATVIAEQFGYGLGFAAFMMYLIYVADGEHKTSHYSIATGFMALGMMLPGMASGYIQEYLGYENFFIWVLIATIPGLVLSQFLEFPKDFGKKTTETKE